MRLKDEFGIFRRTHAALRIPVSRNFSGFSRRNKSDVAKYDAIIPIAFAFQASIDDLPATPRLVNIKFKLTFITALIDVIRLICDAIYRWVGVSGHRRRP